MLIVDTAAGRGSFGVSSLTTACSAFFSAGVSGLAAEALSDLDFVSVSDFVAGPDLDLEEEEAVLLLLPLAFDLEDVVVAAGTWAVPAVSNSRVKRRGKSGIRDQRKSVGVSLDTFGVDLINS